MEQYHITHNQRKRTHTTPSNRKHYNRRISNDIMYNVLIFDLWGTLAYDEEEYSGIVEKALGTVPNGFMNKFWGFGKNKWQIDGKGDPTPYFTEFCQMYDIDENKGEKVLTHIWKESLVAGKLYPWAIPLLRKLKGRFTLVLASNTGIDGKIFLENNHEFKEMFDAIFLSYELGVAKPERSFFKIIINQLSVKGNECLLIDDTKINVQGARRLNMGGIVIQNHARLEEELMKLKIKG